MRHVYLPIEHSDLDLALAAEVAEHLESCSLYVTWGPDGYRQPDVATLWDPVDDEAPATPDRPQHGIWTEALGTVVAFIAALCRPWGAGELSASRPRRRCA